MYFENQEPASKSKIYTAVLFAALLSVRYQSINHICYSKSSPAFFLSEPLSIKRIKTNTKKKAKPKPHKTKISRLLHPLPTCIMSIQLRNLFTVRHIFTAPSAGAFPPKAQLHQLTPAQSVPHLHTPPSALAPQLLLMQPQRDLIQGRHLNKNLP